MQKLPGWKQEQARIEREKAGEVYNPYMISSQLQRQEREKAVVVDSQPPVDYKAQRERELAEKEAAELAAKTQKVLEARQREEERLAALNTPEAQAQLAEEARAKQERMHEVRKNSKLYRKTVAAS